MLHHPSIFCFSTGQYSANVISGFTGSSCILLQQLERIFTPSVSPALFLTSSFFCALNRCPWRWIGSRPRPCYISASSNSIPSSKLCYLPTPVGSAGSSALFQDPNSNGTRARSPSPELRRRISFNAHPPPLFKTQELVSMPMKPTGTSLIIRGSLTAIRKHLP